MACPAADFVEESFLLTVKDVLSKQGLFIINLVSRSPSVKEMVISRLKEVRVTSNSHNLKFVMFLPCKLSLRLCMSSDLHIIFFKHASCQSKNARLRSFRFGWSNLSKHGLA